MSLTRFALKLAAPIPNPESFRRYLFIGPHPDDIEIGAGATIAKLSAAGKQIAFLICMDGRFGLDYAPPETTPQQLAEIRRTEAKASAAALGVHDVFFLDLSDGGFYDYDELIRGMASCISAWQPDILFAPDPHVNSECHIDHLNTGRAAMQMAFFAPFEEIMKGYGAACAPVQALALYMTAKPNRYVKTRGFLKQQEESIFGCHKSQFPPQSQDVRSVSLYLKLRAYDFGLRNFKGQAEGFRVLGRTHMHCLPEAGK